MLPHPLINFGIQKYYQNKFDGVFPRTHFKRNKKKLIGNKNIITNISRIQAFDSIMCGYFCTGFINFTLKDKSILEYTNLFFPDEYEKNDNIILKSFHECLNKLKCIVVFTINVENIRKIKILFIFKKH